MSKEHHKEIKKEESEVNVEEMPALVRESINFMKW